MKNKAFTLIELLVVVLIIGILAAIALPQYEKAVEKSRMAQALAIADALQKAINIHILTNGGTGSYRYLGAGGEEGEEELALDLDFPATKVVSASNTICDGGFSFGGPYCFDMGKFMYKAMCNPYACQFGVVKYNGTGSNAKREYRLLYTYQPSSGWSKSYNQTNDAKANLKPEFASMGFTTN